MPRRRPWGWAGVIVLVAAWVSAGLQPLASAVAGAVAPPDFTRDFVTAHHLVHRTTRDPPEGEAANDYAASIAAPRVELLGAPYHFHPPPALLPVLPLAALGYRGAMLAWLAVLLAAVAALAFALVAVVERRARPPAARVAAAWLLLLLWPPVLHDLAKGQWSIPLAAALAWGWRCLEQGRPNAAGAWLGLAASLKAAPVLLLGYLALRRRRAAAVMLAVIVALGVVSSIVEGPAVWRRWAAAAPAEVAAWQTWVANTASLHGLLARLLAGGPFARPWLEAPALARALTAAASLVLVGTALAVTARAPATPEQERRLFAVWCLLVVLLNPLGWTHTLVIALVAAALLAPDGAPLAAAVIVWTVPRETLERLAGPLPVGAVGGLVLGAHAVATGALVVAAALSGRAAGSAIPSRS